jgi:hypothetical protein
VVLLALGAWQANGLWQFLLAHPRLPLWDMAGHGFQAVQLADDLVTWRWLDFVAHLNAQDKWPFGFSLLLLPFVLVGRASFAAAALPSTVLYAAVPALLAWNLGQLTAPAAGQRGARAVETWAVSATACLLGVAFLLAPLARLFAILVMREMAGVAAVLLTLGATLRALRTEAGGGDRAALRAWTWAAVATLALLLVKFNYGVLWLVSLAVWQALEATSLARRAFAARARAWLWPRGGPWQRWLAPSYLAVLAVLAVAGTNPGIGVYAGLLIASGWLVRAWRRDPDALRQRWQELPLRLRAFVLGLVAPLWLWWLSPRPIHPKEIFAFLRNRPGDPWSLARLPDQLLYYPRSFVLDWMPSLAVGLVVLALAVVAMAAWRRSPGARLLLVATAMHVALIGVHAYRQQRFLATAVPLLLLAAGLGLLEIGRRAAAGGSETRPYEGKARWAMAAMTSATGVAALLLLLPIPPWGATPAMRERRLTADWELHTGAPNLGATLGLLRRQAPPDGRLAVVGGFNELSPSLVKWALSQPTADGDRRDLHFADEPSYPGSRRYDADGALSRLDDATAARAVAGWLADENPTAIAVVQVGGMSTFGRDEDFRRYNAWQQDLLPVIKHLPGWRVAGKVYLEKERLAVLLMVPVRS